ncbi:hypothetical protein ACWCPI_24180 [Streptomyces sp. NPDC001920]
MNEESTADQGMGDLDAMRLSLVDYLMRIIQAPDDAGLARQADTALRDLDALADVTAPASHTR